MKNSSFKFAAIYIVICVAYIIISDHVVLVSSPITSDITNLQTYKGIGFVLLSGLLIFLISNQGFKKVQKINEELKDSLEYHKMIFDKSPLPGFIIDCETLQYKRVNEAAVIKLHRTKQEYLSSKATEYVVGLSRDDLESAFQNIGKNGYTELFVEAVNGRGKTVHEHVFCQNIFFEGNPAILMLVLDVTSIKDLEASVVDRMLDLLDEERQVIASEIHDGIKQYLGLLNGLIKTFKEKFPHTDKEQELLNRMEHVSSIGIEESTRLAHRLMPKLGIDDFKIALFRLIENLNYLKETTFHLELSLNKDYDKEILNNIFRVVQECCRNIRVHSKASKADIRLFEQSNKLHLEIEDNGIGFDSGNMAHSKEHFGLASMRSRASKMNGIFLLKSNPEKGTFISVIVPLIGKTNLA